MYANDLLVNILDLAFNKVLSEPGGGGAHS